MNLVALPWVGTQYCSLAPLSRQNLEVLVEVGTHPVTVGFSTVWQSLTTGVPHILTWAVYYCVQGPNNLSMGLLSHAAFSLTRMTVHLLLYPLRGLLEFISCSSTYILPTKHDQIPSPSKINYPNVLFLGSSLFIYSSIHQLLLVAHCQLSSSTMGVLLTLHLSRQHITAYLYLYLLTPCSYLDSLCFLLLWT